MNEQEFNNYFENLKTLPEDELKLVELKVIGTMLEALSEKATTVYAKTFLRSTLSKLDKKISILEGKFRR